MKKNFKKNSFVKFEKNSKIISSKDLKILKKNSKKNNINTRYCLHSINGDKHQEMIIYQKKNLFFPPKKNTKSDQSFFIIEGKLLIIIFDNYGKIKKKIILSKNKNLYARIKKNTYNCDIPLTSYSIHLETKNCIFNKNVNKFAKFNFNYKKIINNL